jgi:hypothetical protein
MNLQQKLRDKVDHREDIEGHVQVKNTYKGHYGRWMRGEEEAVGTRDCRAIKVYREGKEEDGGPAGKTSGEYNVNHYCHSIPSTLHVAEISFTAFCLLSFPDST